MITVPGTTTVPGTSKATNDTAKTAAGTTDTSATDGWGWYFQERLRGFRSGGSGRGALVILYCF
jgi:hypothetical protein